VNTVAVLYANKAVNHVEGACGAGARPGARRAPAAARARARAQVEKDEGRVG